MTKPMVFNYGDYERVVEENKKLKEDIANLQIRCRIAESDRNCEQCNHNKADGCSRWECEYEPRMGEVVRCKDCRWSESDHSDQDGYFCNHISHNKEWIMFSHCYCVYGERREP